MMTQQPRGMLFQLALERVIIVPHPIWFCSQKKLMALDCHLLRRVQQWPLMGQQDTQGVTFGAAIV